MMVQYYRRQERNQPMLSATDRNVATTFKRRLRSVGPVLDMRVYGSRARGDAHGNALTESPLRGTLRARDDLSNRRPIKMDDTQLAEDTP